MTSETTNNAIDIVTEHIGVAEKNGFPAIGLSVEHLTTIHAELIRLADEVVQLRDELYTANSELRWAEDENFDLQNELDRACDRINELE